MQAQSCSLSFWRILSRIKYSNVHDPQEQSGTAGKVGGTLGYKTHRRQSSRRRTCRLDPTLVQMAGLEGKTAVEPMRVTRPDGRFGQIGRRYDQHTAINRFTERVPKGPDRQFVAAAPDTISPYPITA